MLLQAASFEVSRACDLYEYGVWLGWILTLKGHGRDQTLKGHDRGQGHPFSSAGVAALGAATEDCGRMAAYGHCCAISAVAPKGRVGEATTRHTKGMVGKVPNTAAVGSAPIQLASTVL